MGPREAARATGVSTDTLRHYERVGLLPPVTRTAAGYRRYSPATVQRVLLIQRALVVGFSLGELRRILAIRDGGGAPCRGVRKLVGDRLDAVNQRIAQLQSLRDELRDLLSDWDVRLSATMPGKPARLLDTLAGRPVIEGATRTRVRPSVGKER